MKKVFKMFEGFNDFVINTQARPKVDIHGVVKLDRSSSKPALLLLHGFPQTHHMWHRVAPSLTDHFDVVVPDLRGYGESSKPEEIPEYAKSRMAVDCISVMDQLGCGSSFYVCAHDRGARVAHKLVVDYPDRVSKAIFLDICPTLSMYESTSFTFASRYFHWFFLIQDAPLPEMMITPQARQITEIFIGGSPSDDSGVFAAEAFEAYVKGMSDADCVHAMCNDYRASASLDLEEARQDLAAGKLNKVPLRILWGSDGLIAELYDPIGEWRKVSGPSTDVNGYAVDCGHYIPEEKPDVVLRAIHEFFVL